MPVPPIPNVALDRMTRGGVALGVAIRLVHSGEVAKIMKTAGFDFLFIDREHTPVASDTVSQLCQMAQAMGVTPIVRVPGIERAATVHALDGGAQGIIFPHIDTAEEAAACVQLCRYPPAGQRSMGYGTPQVDFRSYPPKELMAAVNDATLVIVMLESLLSVENAEAIAATEGIDVLHIGSQDMTAELGVPGETGHPSMIEAFGKVAAACARHGKRVGVGGCYNPEHLDRFIALGARFVMGGADLGLLLNGAAQQARTVRGLAAAEAAESGGQR